MINQIHKLTGIPIEKLLKYNLYEIIKDNNIIQDITKIQREKLSYIKDILQHNFEQKDIVKITCSKDITDYMNFLSLESVEFFYIILLNRNNRIIDKIKISQGGISGTVIDVKVIAQHAIVHKASNVILCHNHPSGNIQPSECDKQITNKIKKGLNFLDIKVLDHIIISNNNNYSFADEGYL
jgi:DNA repair protein RadC